MNLKEMLLQPHSKNQSLKIASYIGNDPNSFAELMDLFLNGSHLIVQRSAMAVSLCVSKHNELITPYIKIILSNLKKDTPDVVTRNSLRVLQFIELPTELHGLAADICFSFLESPKTPVAVRVFSMTVLFKICKKEPDLTNELKLLIEDQLAYSTAGFKSRGNKILNEIAKGTTKSKKY